MTGDFRRIVWTIAHLPASACTTSAPGSKSPLGRGGGGGAARIGVLSSFPVVGVRLCAAKVQCQHVGHLVAFGNTEEWLHRQILGCRARNQPAQPPAGGRLPPFDHKTGEGHVPFHGGDYHDARYKKRNQVVPLIVEALGGIGRRGARCLRFLARRASCRKRGRDGTTYSRFHPSNYLSHHLAGIVTAAVFSDAAHIVEEIALLKTRTSGATRTAAAANPIE